MQYSKRIIDFNTKLIEFIVSNLHPVITNRAIIMGPEVNVRIKYPDNIMVSFGKRFQCFGVCWVTKIWYIHIRCVENVFNTFIVVVY